MGSRLYVGNLPSRTTERDLKDFFRGIGHMKDVILKNGFGFVEFEDPRDAEDAIYEKDGRELLGARVVVERSRREYSRGGDVQRNGRDFRGGPQPFFENKSRYRLTVENLSSRCSWQDLKSLMRSVGWVTFADAHKHEKNTGVVYFERHDDLKRAIEKFQGEDVNGRRIKLIDDTRSVSRSRSPRRSPPSSRKRALSRSPSPRRKRSTTRSSSRSPSPRRKRSPTRSASRSPASKRKGSPARPPSRSPTHRRKRSSARSASRSPAPKRKRSPSHSSASPEPRRKRSPSHSPPRRNRSRSKSPSRLPDKNGRASRSPKNDSA